MKYWSTILILFVVFSMLLGCTPEKQAETPPSAESTIPTAELTEPVTEAPTEAPTEPPTEKAEERQLSAFEIFCKAKAAAPDSATQYTTSEHAVIRTGANGITMIIDIHTDTQVSLSDDPFGIHICTDLFTTMTGMEIEQTLHEYYRMEGADLVYYADIEQLGQSVRQVLPEQLYPQIDTEEYPEIEIPTNTEYLLTINSKNGYPPDSYAQYMELEPETQIIDGKEVYVLRYEQSALWLFGFTGDAAIDADLSGIRIPTFWYIDKETFIPIKQEFSMSDLDPLTTAAMVGFLNIQIPEDASNLELEIVEYTYELKDMVFEPTAVPDVPQEVLDRASPYTTAT